MKAHGFCNECKKTNLEVRLYRPYGNFYRVEDTHCNAHISAEQRDWYVPLIFDEDGSVWGYTSVPMDALEAFYALPESDPTTVGWSVQRSAELTHWQTAHD